MKKRMNKATAAAAKLFVCLMLVVSYMAGVVSPAFAADYRPKFKTKDNKHYEYGENVKIKWTGSADSYLIAVRNNTTNKKIVNNKAISGTSCTIKNLTPGDYTVAIAGVKNSATYWCPSVLKFTVEDENLDAPVIKTTSGQQISAGESIKIKWSDCDAEYYIFAMRNTTNDYKPNDKKITKTSYTLDTDGLPDGKYIVNVAAVSETGKKVWSEKSICFYLGDVQEEENQSASIPLEETCHFTSITGKFRELITEDSNYIITVNPNQYSGSDRSQYIATLKYNIEYMIWRAGDAFTQEQVKCLRDIYERQFAADREGGALSDKDLRQIVEIRYEGVADRSGGRKVTNANTNGHADTMNQDKNDENLEFDLFSAMTVVIYRAEVMGVFFRTSTLPDNYFFYPYPTEEKIYTCVIRAGIYDMVTYNYDGYAALLLKQNGSSFLPAIYDEATGDTCNGILQHHNYYSENKRYSAGCLTMAKADWMEYIKLYGGKYSGWARENVYVGKLIVERCIDIYIDEDHQEKATFRVS